MTERTSTERLLEDLEAAHAPRFMLRKACEGQYNDYLSNSATPIMDLVRDATAANLRPIVQWAKAGKYDGTKAEADAWFQREGRQLFGGPPQAE
jgi:hypothetical protein